ncbi:AbrB/MazE/SpoVT family DNA-binding domain-containing protein [Mitsuaria sp. GD03876]|uniref:AbrB/MazE/SpoVT family DNA-binding domain-containing protein n=1 Tax=Mitsuaria sp. GD03876 TaxID=2975399 RepID=UPI002449B0AD|nr:AbrB/MazE/SpoVT family DNA-binding domain-containing protein [Mitsuaria sp. GD03876]MDH0866345.1 AbrB/MazE/SpoVT family DNA-binding domain-containing protein [Mitsuaria sp. GD03876]
MTPTISTEGQITLPAELLNKCDWKAGDELVIVESGQGLFIRRRHRLDDLRGLTRGASTDRYRNGRDRY